MPWLNGFSLKTPLSLGCSCFWKPYEHCLPQVFLCMGYPGGLYCFMLSHRGLFLSKPLPDLFLHGLIPTWYDKCLSYCHHLFMSTCVFYSVLKFILCKTRAFGYITGKWAEREEQSRYVWRGQSKTQPLLGNPGPPVWPRIIPTLTRELEVCTMGSP